MNASSSRQDSLSILQLIFSLAAVLAFTVVAVLLAAGLVFSTEGSSSESLAVSSLYSLLGMMLFFGLLCLPSLIFSAARVFQHPLNPPCQLGKRWNWILLPVWVLSVWAGVQVANQPEPNGLLLAVLNLLGGVLPVLLIGGLVFRHLDAGSAQRRWGVLATGLTLGTGLIIGVETIGLILLVIGVGVVVSSSPSLLSLLEQFTRQLGQMNLNPDNLLESLAPILVRPQWVFLILFALSGIIPLIEEFFKPVAIWILSRRKMTPADGFAVGILSGMAYAIFESLTASASAVSGNWLVIIIARCGTDALHILTTGIMGWGIAVAWKGMGRGYLAAVLSYLAAVCLHGLWNFQTVAAGMAPLLPYASQASPFFSRLAPVAPAGMLIQTVLMVVLLGMSHRFLALKPEDTPGSCLNAAGDH